LCSPCVGHGSAMWNSLSGLTWPPFSPASNRAFEYIGGVPREVLFDNAKVVVSERVGKIVRFNQDLLHYALSAGFTPQACWINDPESKGKVESQVKYVRRGFFYGRKFKDLDHLNHEGAHMV